MRYLHCFFLIIVSIFLYSSVRANGPKIVQDRGAQKATISQTKTSKTKTWYLNNGVKVKHTNYANGCFRRTVTGKNGNEIEKYKNDNGRRKITIRKENGTTTETTFHLDGTVSKTTLWHNLNTHNTYFRHDTTSHPDGTTSWERVSVGAGPWGNRTIIKGKSQPRPSLQLDLSPK